LQSGQEGPIKPWNGRKVKSPAKIGRWAALGRVFKCWGRLAALRSHLRPYCAGSCGQKVNPRCTIKVRLWGINFSHLGAFGKASGGRCERWRRKVAPSGSGRGGAKNGFIGTANLKNTDVWPQDPPRNTQSSSPHLGGGRGGGKGAGGKAWGGESQNARVCVCADTDL
jgi:hypothetical protein